MGNAILHRSRAAGVFGDVAAYGTGIQTCRIRRVEKSPLLYFPVQFTGDNTGLDGGKEILFINLYNFVHLFHGQYQAAMNRHRTAAQTLTGAPWSNREIFFLSEFHKLRYLLG